jgi:hypothetical protein
MFADANRRPRPVVACVDAARPDQVWLAEIDHHGRTRKILSDEVEAQPPADLLADLARLTRRVDRTFEGHHDVDWVARPDGSVRLIDIRPGLTTTPDQALATVDEPIDEAAGGPPASIALTLALRSAVSLNRG